MINNEMRRVQVLTYSDETDAYGQRRQGSPTVRFVDMFCKIFSQVNVNNPNYVDIDMIGLTDDKDITDKDVILIGDEKYNIKYVIPSSRKYQIMMRKS